MITGCGPSALQYETKYVCPGSPYLHSELVLHKDGTFRQMVSDKNGHQMNIDGRWTRKNDGITFDRFLWLLDENADKPVWTNEPKEVSLPTGTVAPTCVSFREDDVRFAFDISNNTKP